jgi:hypothetical protein
MYERERMGDGRKEMDTNTNMNRYSIFDMHDVDFFRVSTFEDRCMW